MMHLELVKRIRKKSWLFAGICVIPVLLPLALLAYEVACGSFADTCQIPRWLGIVTYVIWTLLVGLTGALLFLCLAFLLDLDSSLIAKPRTKGYLTLFAIAWNLIFGYLAMASFGLGLDHAYGVEVVTRGLTNILCSFPVSVLLSLTICAGLVAVVVACVESMIWIVQKVNPAISKVDDR